MALSAVWSVVVTPLTGRECLTCLARCRDSSFRPPANPMHLERLCGRKDRHAETNEGYSRGRVIMLKVVVYRPGIARS